MNVVFHWILTVFKYYGYICKHVHHKYKGNFSWKARYLQCLKCIPQMAYNLLEKKNSNYTEEKLNNNLTGDQNRHYQWGTHKQYAPRTRYSQT